jgi:hypothetical protein
MLLPEKTLAFNQSAFGNDTEAALELEQQLSVTGREVVDAFTALLRNAPEVDSDWRAAWPSQLPPGGCVRLPW